ncbi:hypothetical protein PF005_g22490 [Phytophthora fragariae]|uniref:Uncharacterized protein n=1 Tax=Phytophthora fragariae TaxID=53985 RepID=A0A6A3QTT0_9STRA|nr:hypothetical protein PF003_g15788 [Phytophthora fragariae]KAE9083179.1 hypothetical protein PF007_g22005 [Phytophthora fragariae]KAE9182439.1 hypothetical protein PF005_g22490 [Phytophthora fragariae]KAE9193462.1 hypothetical protein PF004_g21008 [Phytophthora fragariae]
MLGYELTWFRGGTTVGALGSWGLGAPALEPAEPVGLVGVDHRCGRPLSVAKVVAISRGLCTATMESSFAQPQGEDRGGPLPALCTTALRFVRECSDT